MKSRVEVSPGVLVSMSKGERIVFTALAAVDAYVQTKAIPATAATIKKAVSHLHAPLERHGIFIVSRRGMYRIVRTAAVTPPQDPRLEDDIPIPRKGERLTKYPWRTARVDQSFEYFGKNAPQRVFEVNRELSPKRFRSGKLSDGTTRIWRVE